MIGISGIKPGQWPRKNFFNRELAGVGRIHTVKPFVCAGAATITIPAASTPAPTAHLPLHRRGRCKFSLGERTIVIGVGLGKPVANARLNRCACRVLLRSLSFSHSDVAGRKHEHCSNAKAKCGGW